MKIRLTAVLVIAAVTALGCSNGTKSRVYQGVCVKYSATEQVLELKNTQPKLNPIPGETAVFNLAKAKVGLTPDPGDVIRVAYKTEGNSLLALKLMNVSKQDLRK